MPGRLSDSGKHYGADAHIAPLLGVAGADAAGVARSAGGTDAGCCPDAADGLGGRWSRLLTRQTCSNALAITDAYAHCWQQECWYDALCVSPLVVIHQPRVSVFHLQLCRQTHSHSGRQR